MVRTLIAAYVLSVIIAGVLVVINLLLNKDLIKSLIGVSEDMKTSLISFMVVIFCIFIPLLNLIIIYAGLRDIVNEIKKNEKMRQRIERLKRNLKVMYNDFYELMTRVICPDKDYKKRKDTTE